MLLTCSQCGQEIVLSEITDRLNFVDFCPVCGYKIQWQRLFFDYISGKNRGKRTSLSGKVVKGRSLPSPTMDYRIKAPRFHSRGHIILA